MKKSRIILEVLPEQKRQLQERARQLNLTMKDYLVLKGLDILREEVPNGNDC